METKTKNRGWVKNVAIIFLAVMLVLTFFSNTIMNRSLPEVATQSVSSGTITARIRGTGTVTSNQNYEVKLEQTRTVKTVMIKEGQEVNAGDVLFVLADTESAELEAAQETLRQLNLSYQKALINAADADYAKENRDIQLAKEALQEAEEKRDSLIVTAADIAIANENVSAAKDDVTFAQRQVDNAKKELEDVGEIVDSSSNITALRKQLSAKEDELSVAQRALDTARTIYGSDYEALVSAAQDEFEALGNVDEYFNYNRMTDDEKRSYIIDYYLPYVVDDLRALTKAEGNADGLSTYVYLTDDIKAEPEKYVEAYEEITACQETVDSLSADVNSIEEQILTARRNDNSGIYDDYVEALDRANTKLAAAQEAQTEAEQALADLKTKKSDYETALSTVKSCQTTLEDLLFSLSEQQKADDKNAQLESLDMQDMLAQISKQQETVDELKADSVDKEIKAEVSGIIASVDVTAGSTTTPGSPMATIELPDMGYSLSFSVTNDQARRVHTGDTATVSNYYWGSEINAVLTSIKTDPKNPQSNKLLVFDLSGDVTVGSSLTISVGDKSAEYDYVVPNSALRSDSNGDFVLVVNAKNSPLGNRYIATRVDVTILASDDTSSAVSGGLNRGDFVISTSTKPVENGDQVRMADS